MFLFVDIANNEPIPIEVLIAVIIQIPKTGNGNSAAKIIGTREKKNHDKGKKAPGASQD